MKQTQEKLASEILRALRGKRRSRPSFSRYLGYRSNISQCWETGLSWPTATTFFRVLVRLRIEPRACVAAFLRREPPWLASASMHDPAGVSAFLSELRGRTPIGVLAQRCGYNRFSISRWLKGSAVPKLPELLALIEATTGRLLDFVATIVDPALLPSTSAQWRKLLLARELAYTHPISHAVLRALELDLYQRPRASEQDIARHLGLPATEVKRALALLQRAGQVRRAGRKWVVPRPAVVDTGGDPQRARQLKLAWARTALDRLESGAPGHSGYAVFAISREGLLRLREIQLAFVREMQAVIADSKNSECIGLYCAQLIDLAEPALNVFQPRPDPGQLTT